MRVRILMASAFVLALAACGSDPVVQSQNSGANGTNGTPPAADTGNPGDKVAGDQIDANALSREFTANVGDRVFFDTDKSDLKADAREQLSKWVAFLRKYPADKLVIEGYADERGTVEYDLALGDRRAAAVKAFLIAEGVDGGRLSTISYGKARPAVEGSNETSWAQNRRAVGVLHI